MASPHNSHQNHLLAALPPEDFERLEAHLECVPMRLGEVLYEPGRLLKHAFFPTTAIVSLHYVMETGSSSEIAGVGNEGVVGVSVFLGGDTTPSSAMVQTAGHGYRIPCAVFKEQFNRGGPMQHLLLRYSQALMTQIAQTAACNRHHTVEQQLARMLLLILDRMSSNELVMTQELVARLLGVRRVGVTEAACRLQSAGFIRYRRGHISVLDRDKLETRGCECYGVVRREMARLMNNAKPRHEAPTEVGKGRWATRT